MWSLRLFHAMFVNNDWNNIQMLKWALCWILLELSAAFTFIYPSVSPADLTINTLTTYTFLAMRNYDLASNPTPYATQPVPAGATIVIQFPTQYTLTAPNVTTVLVNDAAATGFGFSLASNNITITNAIVSSTAVANVTIVVTNVLNPYPAITTSPFIIAIGSDTSASSTSSAITLTPATFASCAVTFSPSSVNTTGAMVVSITPSNKILANNSVVIAFPLSLQWSQDISTTHTLPIGSSVTCSRVSGGVTAASCSGSVSTAQVTYLISGVSGSAVSSGFSYSIGSLFSPPTTSPPDTLEIRSVSSTGDTIDTCTASITGLTPQSLTLGLSSSMSPLYVNSPTSLIFSFTLTDTIVKSDFFQITFPPNTTFAFSIVSSSNLSIFNSGVTYNSSNLTLTIRQATTSSTKFAGTLCSITLAQYKAPPSTKTTDPFTFQVYNSAGGLKMQGSATLTASPNTYVATVTPSTFIINKSTNYSFTVTSTDAMLSSGMIQLRFPSQLTLAATSSCIATNNFTATSSPLCTANGTNTILITNISNATIAAGTYTFAIQTVTNAPKALTTSNFTLNYYYTNDSSARVGSSNITGITLLPNSLDSSTIAVQLSNNSVTASAVTMNVSFTAADAVGSNGYITIVVPSQIGIVSSYVSQCMLYIGTQSAIPSCSLNASTFTVPLGALAISAGQNITVTLIGFAVLPKSTRPTGFFSIYSYSADNFMVDYSNSSYRVSSLVPVGYSLLSLSQANRTNSLSTVYNLKMQQNSPWDSNSYLLVQLPPAITATNSSISCADSNTNTPIPCTYTISTPNYINISLASSGSSLDTKISALVNPESCQPTSAFLFTTYTSDGYLYAYDNSSVTITNNAPSAFTAFSYSFSSSTYNSSSTLILNITNLVTSTSGYSLTSFSQFVNSSISSISCSSSLDLSCTMNGSALIINPIVSNSVFPVNTSIVVSGLFIPLANVSSMSALSFSQGYLVSRYDNITWQPSCTLPCYTCNPNTPTVCLSCYSTTVFTSLIYFYSNSCLAACPPATLSTNGSLTCTPCDSNCAECSLSALNCTQCVQSSTNNMLVLSNRSCVSSCPTGYYSTASNLTKYTPVCQSCVAPCATCSNATSCLTCSNSSLFFYSQKCVGSCPLNTTVANLTSMQCDPCTSSCSTCTNTTSTCLSCNPAVAPLFVAANSSCVAACPTPLVSDNNNTVCVSCQSPCSTCSLVKTNCTGCLASTNTYLSGVTAGACVSSCEQFYFANATSQKCQGCSTVVNLNCNNCFNSTYCLSCDPGYVLFTPNHSCLSNVPSGYINISGIATACTNNCTECSNSVDNCTVCSGSYSLYTWVNAGSCLTACPNTTISITNVCMNCTSPCSTCSNVLTNCTSCLTGYLYAVSSGNQCATVCPNGTYSSVTSSSCLSCTSPCLTCLGTATNCTSCSTGYLYNQACLSSCPSNTMANSVQLTCDTCVSPCLTCQNQTQNCTSCISNYYYYSATNRCYLACPTNVSIAGTGTSSFICVQCTSPCATCSISLTNCTSCASNLLYFNFSCVDSCTNGYYANAGICSPCSNNCATCANQSSYCLSCSASYKFYQNTCITTCPVAYSIIVNGTCTGCSSGCLNCSAADYCYQCPQSTVLIDGKCSTTCPSPLVMYYNESTNKFVCGDVNGTQQQQILKSSLQLSSVLPLPFTIISSFLFVCCLMSKLQFIHTYITGIGYSLFGCAESGAIAYLLYIYVKNYSSSPNSDYRSQLLLLIVCVGIIVGLNTISLLLITPCLCSDVQFKNWLSSRKRGTPPKQEEGTQQLSEDVQTLGSEQIDNETAECCSHRCSFVVFTLLSFVVSFKLRLFIFTRLFGFKCLSAHLEDVHGFRVFNLMSVLGIAYEGLCCYICYKMFILYTFASDFQLMMAVIDSLVMVIVSFIFALLTTQKEADFFKVKLQTKKGVDLGRRKKGKDPKNFKIDSKRLTGMNSRDKLVDINESLSNLGEEAEEIIVNHNIDSKFLPKRVSSSWVERTTPRRRSKSPLGKTDKNIFEVEEQGDSYSPTEAKNTMSARDRVELFHTSVRPKKAANNVANSFWVENEKKQSAQVESKFQKSAVTFRDRAQSSIKANLTFDDQKKRKNKVESSKQIYQLEQESRIKPKQGQRSIKVSKSRPINLAHLEYFQDEEPNLPQPQKKDLIKQLQSEGLNDRKQKPQTQPKQAQTQRQLKPTQQAIPFQKETNKAMVTQKGSNKNNQKGIDVAEIQQMDKSIEQGRIIDSKEKSFQSVLPFIHQNGLLKEKTPKKQQQPKNMQTQAKVTPSIKDKHEVGVDAKSVVIDHQQLLNLKEKKELEQMLDISAVQQKSIPPNQKERNKASHQKMSLATGQIHQTIKPQQKPSSKTMQISNQQPSPKSKTISLSPAQPISKVQPLKTTKLDIQQLEVQQKSRKNAGLKAVKEVNQTVQPHKQSKKSSQVVHAPKIYSRNKLVSNQQLQQIEEIEEFDLKLNKKELQLQRIKEQLKKNNYLMPPKPQTGAHSVRRKKTDKNDIESLISQARNAKDYLSSKHLQVQDKTFNSRADRTEEYAQEQIENIQFKHPTENIDITVRYRERQMENGEFESQKPSSQQNSNLQNRNIFDKQLYSQSEALQEDEIDAKTFKKRSQNFQGISQTEENYVAAAGQRSVQKSKNESQRSEEELQDQSNSFEKQSEKSQVSDRKDQIVNQKTEQDLQEKQTESVSQKEHSQEQLQATQGLQQVQQHNSRNRHEMTENQHSQSREDLDSSQKGQRQQVSQKSSQRRLSQPQYPNEQKNQQSQLQQAAQQPNKANSHSQNRFQAIKVNQSYQQNEEEQSNQIYQVNNQAQQIQNQKRFSSKPPYLVENVAANISETEGDRYKYTAQKIDQNYEDQNELQSSEQQEKKEIQLRKTNKKQRSKTKRYEEQEGQYKSPFVFDQNSQPRPKQLAVDYDHGMMQKARKSSKLSKDTSQMQDQKGKSSEEVIKLLSNVNKGTRNRKMLPKEQRDQRILIKMNRDQSNSPRPRNVENTNLVRKSTQKKNPLSTFKYEKKEEEYSQDQDLTQTKRQAVLAKINTAQNFPIRKTQQANALNKQKSAIELLQLQSAFSNNVGIKVRKPQVQVREFNFGDQISSQISNTNYNSEAQLVKWKENFVRDSNSALNNDSNYDVNYVPDRPLVNKISALYDQEGQQLSQIAQKPRKSKRRRSKKRSKEKGKSSSRNKNSQLQRIYGI